MATVVIDQRRANTIVIWAGWATGAFCLLLLFVLILYWFHITPMWMVQWAASVWDMVCLVYLILQAAPLGAALSLSDREYKVDQYTSWAPVVLWAIGLGFFGYHYSTAPIGMGRILIDTALTCILEWIFVHAVKTLREEWRVTHNP